ncbi:integrase [Klebsiella pneumoniae]|nr:integrase [Klebsiella pneumoniae]
MARKTKPLTDTEIKAAKPKDADYQLYDGDGLTLLIKSSGSKLWQFRYYRPQSELSRALEPTLPSHFLMRVN